MEEVDKLNDLRSRKTSDFEVLHPFKVALGNLIFSGD